MKTIHKMRMIRPTDALLPITLFAACVAGRTAVAEEIYRFHLISLLLGLASARGLRQAFSEQPSLRRVRGSVIMTLLLQVVSALITTLIDLIRSGGADPAHITCIVTGTLLNIEHMFYEYLFALGDGRSAGMCRFITSALLLGGILMTSTHTGVGLLPYYLEYPLAAAAISAIVSAVISMSTGGKLVGKPNSQVIKCAPWSMTQALVYPFAWRILALIPGSPVKSTVTAAPFFAGLAVYELCRAPFRRTAMESAVMNRALMAVGTLSLVIFCLCQLPDIANALSEYLGAYRHEPAASAISTAAACVCGFGMFGSLKVKDKWQ